MLGPCIICGAVGYSPSMGGPDICPRCDTGAFDNYALMKNIQKLRNRVKELEEENERLKADLAGGDW